MTPTVIPQYLKLPELLALTIWREARGEEQMAKLAVGCSIRNRVRNPRWWGKDYQTVILKPWQYSSFNEGDPNAKKYPIAGERVWELCLDAARDVENGCPDYTDGADSYFDQSLISNPPTWAKAETSHLTAQYGRLFFYKTI